MPDHKQGPPDSSAALSQPNLNHAPIRRSQAAQRGQRNVPLGTAARREACLLPVNLFLLMRAIHSPQPPLFPGTNQSPHPCPWTHLPLFIYPFSYCWLILSARTTCILLTYLHNPASPPPTPLSDTFQNPLEHCARRDAGAAASLAPVLGTHTRDHTHSSNCVPTPGLFCESKGTVEGSQKNLNEQGRQRSRAGDPEVRRAQRGEAWPAVDRRQQLLLHRARACHRDPHACIVKNEAAAPKQACAHNAASVL